MKNIFFELVVVFVSFLIFSCKSEIKQENSEQKSVLSEGLYINQTLLDHLNENIIWWEEPRIGEQITILKGDTIDVDNYIEKAKFHFSYMNDSVIRIDPLMYGAAFTFHIMNDKTLHLTDTLNNKDGSTSKFVKSDKLFPQLLNEKLIAGNYSVIGISEKKTIVFSADGSISDWEYDQFELCYAGDCAEMPAEPANIIILKKGDKIEFRTIKIEKRQDGRYMKLHKLKEGAPDEKGNMSVMNDSLVLKNIY